MRWLQGVSFWILVFTFCLLRLGEEALEALYFRHNLWLLLSTGAYYLVFCAFAIGVLPKIKPSPAVRNLTGAAVFAYALLALFYWKGHLTTGAPVLLWLGGVTLLTAYLGVALTYLVQALSRPQPAV